MKVAVIGSRTISLGADELTSILPAGTTEIITGGAAGVDTAAELYAASHKLSVHIIRPDYDKHGKTAPVMRDMRIVELSDLIIAVWDGASKGTAFTVKYARELGKPVKIFKK